MKGKPQRRTLLLAACMLLLWGAVWVAQSNAYTVRAPDHAVREAAAARMERCVEAVRGYKQERGIALSSEDWFGTGLIGEEFNMMTTTLGALSAKRTTANPDMAALAVRMLDEAGVRPGGLVAVGLSGSFPGMNLAVLSACAELDIRVRCVSSVGASTYGANNPTLTFPEMLGLLVRDGLLPEMPLVVTLGGDADCGYGMEEALREAAAARIQEMGLTLWREPDFEKNIAGREAFYEQDGPVDCYIGVGGNLASIGRGDDGGKQQGVLLPHPNLPPPPAGSGLLLRYRARGIPAINLLNIERLAADYGFPFDPSVWPARGTGPLYETVRYPRTPIVLALAGAMLLLLGCRKGGKPRAGNS